MDIVDLVAQARPSSLDPRPDNDRRARDLARAIGTPRAGRGAARPSASLRRGVRRPSPRARVVAFGTSIAAVAGTAGAVAALSVTGTPAARPQPAAAHPGTAITTPGEIRNAILTAFNGVGGDVFYTRITEIFPGTMSRWNEVSENWSYPLQPRARQRVHVRSLVLPSNLKDKSDTEWIYTEPVGGTQSGSTISATKTEMIDVQYGNRTWSDTTGMWGFGSETASLQDLREAIIEGKFTSVRKVKLDGRTVLELTSHSKIGGTEATYTWWVDPGTYLPVRMLTTQAGFTYQVDYGFRPATPANIAQLKVTIPAGFIRTPTQKLP
jgi:hypothetical protein